MGKPWIVGVAITAVMALGMGTVAKANKVEFTTSGYFTVANPSSDVYVASGSLHLYGSTVSFTEGGGTFTVSNPNAGQTFNVST
jgi:Fe-S cluster assembly iron-binding protein IscA